MKHMNRYDTDHQTPKHAKRTPLWLDCDPGHDDAFAILLAAYHPGLDLLGISTVHGNASLEKTTANAGSILTTIGRSDIPLHPGSAKPFCRKAVHAADIHGDTGLDGTEGLPEPAVVPIRDPNAILAMYAALFDQPEGEPWLVATGALTNIALLFSAFPEVAGHIKGLSIMGGAIGGNFTDAPMGHLRGEGERIGNTSRWAEFNIYCDPEAAQSIFSNPVLAAKTTLIPLDLTHQVLATEEVQQQLLNGPSNNTKSSPSNIRQLFHELLIFFAHTYADVFGLKAGPPLHDPIAVAVILFDQAWDNLKFNDGDGERWHVNITTEGLHSDIEKERGEVGRTVATKVTGHGGGVRVPRGLDVQLFWTIIEQCVERAESELRAQGSAAIAATP